MNVDMNITQVILNVHSILNNNNESISIVPTSLIFPLIQISYDVAFDFD
jgi:hypothetical protein